MDELEKYKLDMIVENIPMNPPLISGGDLSVKDMYPDLTDEELDYVFSKYKGTMRKSGKWKES